MIAFRKALPKIRQLVARDLKQRGLGRAKVLAAMVRLLETTLIRVGNEEYAKQNRSFGLSTMRDRHVVFKHGTIHFEFKGKSGKRHEIDRYNPKRRLRTLEPGEAAVLAFLQQKLRAHRPTTGDLLRRSLVARRRSKSHKKKKSPMRRHRALKRI